jgi:hypothetical protein
MNFKQYDVVKIKSFKNPNNLIKSIDDERLPEIGDIATIIEIYNKPRIGYELECSNSKNGFTIWLHSFAEEEIELEKVY